MRENHVYGPVVITTVDGEIVRIQYAPGHYVSPTPGKGQLHTRLGDNWREVIKAITTHCPVFEVEYVGEDGRVRDYLELRLWVDHSKKELKAFKL